jgi:transposase
MPLKPKLTARHTAEQLAEEVRKARSASYRDRLRFILFMVQGFSLTEAASRAGFRSRRHAQLLRARYDRGGLDALAPIKPKRPKNSGSKPLLDDAQRALLASALQGPAPDGGLWTGPKVARWIAAQTGRAFVGPQSGWNYLRKLGFVLRRPRPKHHKRDEAAQAVFKKPWRPLPRLLPGEPGAGGGVVDGRAPAGAQADPAAGVV